MGTQNLDPGEQISQEQPSGENAPFGSNYKTIWYIVFLALAISGLFYYLYQKFLAKTDDWVYQGSSEISRLNDILSNKAAIIGALVAIVVVFILGIIFFIIGKRLKAGARRKLGYILRYLGGTILFLYLFIISALGALLLNVLLAGKLLDTIDDVSNIRAINRIYVFSFLIIGCGLLLIGIIRTVKNRKIEIEPFKTKRFYLPAILFLLIFPVLLLLEYRVNIVEQMGSGFGASQSISLSAGYGGGSYGTKSLPAMAPVAESLSLSEDSLGFSVGGAKDINNFRENIKNDYLPLPTDITYEGLFYDYYFDTGQTEECTQLFCPSYSYAISPDPFSGEEEYYLSVGLNSNLKESDFQRKKLNLVIVLDISGSMGSSFDQYYYDQFGNQQKIEEENEDAGKSKMQIANKAVVSLLDNLNGDDRFGMVLFDDEGYLAKPLNLVSQTDMDSIKSHIMDIQDQGGTNMSAGMKLGTEQFVEFMEADKSEYENRIIFLTDAMPNLGDISQEGLFGMAEENSKNGIYSTFIGVGLDFNTELVEAITKIKGANYYSVHSSDEFITRMDDEFEFMVTPLVFDLNLTLEADGYDIEKVYGSPEADQATGEIMKVNTLFPSRTKEGETRGGLVLLKLKKTSPTASLKLKASYYDRNNQPGGDEVNIEFAKSGEYYANNGIRKGIVLSRYVNLIKDWINDERAKLSKEPIIIEQPIPMDYAVSWEEGIGLPDHFIYQLGEWERQSAPLKVSAYYKDFFNKFKEYLNKEVAAVNDPEMEREVEVLDLLLAAVQPEDENIVGGDCAYDEFPGICTITSVEQTTDSIKQGELNDNSGYEGYEVKFKYMPTESTEAIDSAYLSREQSLLLANSWYPGDGWLEKYSVSTGQKFACSLKKISTGTCTPILFSFEDLDLADYMD